MGGNYRIFFMKDDDKLHDNPPFYIQWNVDPDCYSLLDAYEIINKHHGLGEYMVPVRIVGTGPVTIHSDQDLLMAWNSVIGSNDTLRLWIKFEEIKPLSIEESFSGEEVTVCDDNTVSEDAVVREASSWLNDVEGVNDVVKDSVKDSGKDGHIETEEMQEGGEKQRGVEADGGKSDKMRAQQHRGRGRRGGVRCRGGGWGVIHGLGRTEKGKQVREESGEKERESTEEEGSSSEDEGESTEKEGSSSEDEGDNSEDVGELNGEVRFSRSEIDDFSGEAYEFSDDNDDEWLYDVDDGKVHNDESVVIEEEDDHDLSDAGSQDSHDGYSEDEVTGQFVKRQTKKFDDHLKQFSKAFKRNHEGKIVFEKGQIFRDVTHFRQVLRDYGVEEGYEFCKKKNEKTRVRAMCEGDDCTWMIYASVLPDGKTFMVKTLQGNHKCVRPGTNKNATAKWISEKLDHLIKEDHDVKNAVLQAQLMKDYGLSVPEVKLYRAKRRSRDEAEEIHKTAYVKLRKWTQVLTEANPGSVAKMQFCLPDPTAMQPVFRKIFVAFDCCIKGFVNGCRPFIGIDGCFLKGPYGGICLAAVGVDANNGILPLAVAIVDSETTESYMFFLECLKLAVGDAAWTFMSDKQKGLLEAVPAIFPQATHRFCVRHLYANFRSKFGGLALRLDFWRAAKSYNLKDFNRHMKSIENLTNGGEAYEWLNSKDPKNWTRMGFDVFCKVDNVTNNVTESFNNWIGKIRRMNVYNMLEKYRIKVMTRIQSRATIGRTWTSKLTPKALQELDKRSKAAMSFTPIPAGQGEFQVMHGTNYEVVKLNEFYCSCNQWAVTGLPCVHAIVCIDRGRLNLEDYCSQYHTVAAYLKTYENILHPLPPIDITPDDPNTAVQPPILKRRAGRPRLKRIREVGESSSHKRSSTVKCKKCGQFGHNTRTCQGQPSKKHKTFRPTAWTETGRSATRGRGVTRGRGAGGSAARGGTRGRGAGGSAARGGTAQGGRGSAARGGTTQRGRGGAKRRGW